MQQAGAPSQDQFPPALLPALFNLAQAAPELFQTSQNHTNIPSAEQVAAAAHQAALQPSQEAQASAAPQPQYPAAGGDGFRRDSTAVLPSQPWKPAAATGVTGNSRESSFPDIAAADAAARSRSSLVWQGLDAQPGLPVALFLGGSELALLLEDVQRGHAEHAAGLVPEGPKLPPGAAAYPLLLQLHLHQVLKQQQALASEAQQQQQQQQQGADTGKAARRQLLLDHAHQMLLAAAKGLQEEAALEKTPGEHRPQQQQQQGAAGAQSVDRPAQQQGRMAVRLLQHAAQQLLHAAAAPDNLELMAAAYAAVDAVTWRLHGPPTMQSPQQQQQQEPQQHRQRPQVLNLGAPADREDWRSPQALRGAARSLQQPDSALSPRTLGLPPRPPSAAAADTPRGRRAAEAHDTNNAAVPVKAGAAAVPAHVPPAPTAGGGGTADVGQGSPALQPPSSTRGSNQEGLPQPAAAGSPAGVAPASPGCGATGISHTEASWAGPDEAFAGKPVVA